MAVFELTPDNRNTSVESVVQDVRQVAEILGRTPTAREYSGAGRYSQGVIRRTLGTWNAALVAAGFRPLVKSSVDIDTAVKDLQRVADQLSYAPTQFEYDQLGRCSAHTLRRHFGSWNSVLSGAGLTARFEKNIPTNRLFGNLEEVWVRLGRQPTYADMNSPQSKISAKTYTSRFGTWRGALEAFVTAMNATDEDFQTIDSDATNSTTDSVEPPLRETFGPRARTVNLRIRFRVMQRDRFSCVACGRTPARDPAVQLHVDHVIAWSKGGDATMENLQTLCSDCNIGKSDLDFDL